MRGFLKLAAIALAVAVGVLVGGGGLYALGVLDGDGEAAPTRAESPAEVEEMTTAETFVPSLASSIVTAWCEPFHDPDLTDYTRDAEIALSDILTIAAAGMGALRRSKPAAEYNDRFGLGVVSVEVMARSLARDLVGCGSEGRDAASELASGASP